MSDSLGQKFRAAREQRGLSVEDVARALKIKPARVEDLENDTYTNFASIAYAKGFVLNYGKFIGVQTKPYLAAFDCSHSLGLGDFQYLSGATSTEHLRPLPPADEKKGGFPIFKVLGTLGVAAVVVLLAGFGFYYLRFQQLGLFDGGKAGPRVSEERIEPGAAPEAEPTLSETPATESIASDSDPVATLSPQDLLDQSADEFDVQAALDRLAREDRALLTSSLSGQEVPAASDSETVIVIRPIKRTFVRVVSGESDSDPLFQSVLEPGADPVEFSGQRFLIESTEDQALEIFRNGKIIAQPSGRVVIE